VSNAEKSLPIKTRKSATHAGLSLMLSELSLIDQVVFLSKSLNSNPLVAVATIITNEELNNYYVKNQREDE